MQMTGVMEHFSLRRNHEKTMANAHWACAQHETVRHVSSRRGKAQQSQQQLLTGYTWPSVLLVDAGVYSNAKKLTTLTSRYMVARVT